MDTISPEKSPTFPEKVKIFNKSYVAGHRSDFQPQAKTQIVVKMTHTMVVWGDGSTDKELSTVEFRGIEEFTEVLF